MSQSTYVHAFGNTRFEQERDPFMNPVTILANKLKIPFWLMPLQKQTTNPDDKNHQETKFRMQNKQT